MHELEKDVSFKEIVLLIQEWAIYIFSKWKMLLLALLFGGIIGLVYSWNQKVSYTATLTYTLEDGGGASNQNSTLALANQFGFGGSMTGGGAGLFTSSNLTDLMRSKLIFYDVLLSSVEIEGKETSIADYYLSLYNPNKKIHFPPRTPREKLTTEQVLVIREIYSDLSSEDKLSFQGKGKKTSFSQVVVTSSNEKFAKIFCEALVNITSKAYIDSKVKKTTKNIELIQNQIDSVRSLYSNSLISQAAETDNIFNLNPSLKSKGTRPIQKQIDVQASSALLSSLITGLESARSTLRNQTPLFQIIDLPEYPLDKEVSPNRKSFILIFGFISLILVLAFLILKKLYIQLMNQ
jgi:uncharacterized protein involved in exopolysaccharide biosynthesis